MNELNIGRVQRDLDTMRQAVEARAATSKEDILVNLGIAAIGAVLSCTTAWSGVARAGDGRPSLLYVAFVLVAAAAVAVHIAVVGAIRRHKNRAFFEYSLKAMVAAVLASVVYLAFMVYASFDVISVGSLALATVLFAGVFQLVSLACEVWNPIKFGWGATFVCMAFVLPLGTYEMAGVIAGAFMTVGGALVSLLVAAQLRRPKNVAN